MAVEEEQGMTQAFNSGPELGISVASLRGWIGWQLDKWVTWAEAQPDAAWLAVETGNTGHPTVGAMLVHAFSPIRRYAERTLGQEPFDDSAVRSFEFEEFAEFARECLAIHARAAAGFAAIDARQPTKYMTRSAGEWTVTAEEAFVHSLTHCFWHLGGIAQLLRSHGIAPPQFSDLLFFCAEQRRDGV
jgi:uncharacterized damage-inducible protein DinB